MQIYPTQFDSPAPQPVPYTPVPSTSAPVPGQAAQA